MTGYAGDLHGLELVVAGTKHDLRLIVLHATVEDFRGSPQHDPSEPTPVFVVAIGHHRYHGVLGDILQALEHGAGSAFWFLVDRKIERVAAHRETYRHHMGDSCRSAVARWATLQLAKNCCSRSESISPPVSYS